MQQQPCQPLRHVQPVPLPEANSHKCTVQFRMLPGTRPGDIAITSPDPPSDGCLIWVQDRPILPNLPMTTRSPQAIKFEPKDVTSAQVPGTSGVVLDSCSITRYGAESAQFIDFGMCNAISPRNRCDTRHRSLVLAFIQSGSPRVATTVRRRVHRVSATNND